MAETYPAEVETFKVVGRLVKGIIDSGDVGQNPDVVPVAGATVTFTPSMSPPIFKVANSLIPITVFQETIVATTDADGYLIAPLDPTRGIFLAYGFSAAINPTGWTWTVKISVGGTFPDRTFSITGGPGTTVDLAKVIPVPSVPGSTLPQWQSVVLEVEAARDSALQYSAEVAEVRNALDGYLSPEALAETVATEVSEQDIPSQVATAVAGAPAVTSSAALAAATAVTSELQMRELIEADDPRMPKSGDPDSFRIIDDDGRVAFKVTSDGVTHAMDLETRRLLSGDAEILPGKDSESLTVSDSEGNVAFRVGADGRTFIAEPIFGKELGLSEYEKIILVIGTGQSNSEGRGKPFGSRLDRPNRRHLMTTWLGTATNPYVSGLVEATVPLASQQQQIGLSIQTIIARKFLRETDDRTLVVSLNAAAGGSGLIAAPSQGNWGVNYSGSNPKLYTICRAAITATLNLLAAQYPGIPIESWIVWHQGEADSAATEAAYATEWDAVMTGLRSLLGDSTIPIVSGGIVPENPPGAGVRRALFASQTRNEYVAYTDGIPNGGGSQSTTDTVHYGREGVERLGDKMFYAALRAATATSTVTPHKPLDISATFVQGTLKIVWSEPITRYTNFVVEYRIDGGAWVTAARTIPTECAETVTGLSGTVVEVRISTVNAALTSASTIPVTAVGV